MICIWLTFLQLHWIESTLIDVSTINMAYQGKDNSLDNEHEISLSCKAFDEFKKSCFDDCLYFLKKLSEARPNDARVLLNKTIAEYYQSSCSRTDEFRKQLQIIRKQVINEK